MGSTTADRESLKSLTSALDLLDCFTDHEEVGVAEVAREIGVAKSTAHRLLTTLVSRGLVTRNPYSGRYRLGLHLFELGETALSRHALERAASPVLEDLREHSRCTVQLAVSHGADVLFLHRTANARGVDRVPDDHRRMPAHVTAAGTAICAFDPAAAHAAIDAGLDDTYDEGDFLAELASVRARGYAMSRGEFGSGLGSVAAPVLDRSGVAVAAVVLTGDDSRIGGGDQRPVVLVSTAARHIARRVRAVPHHVSTGRPVPARRRPGSAAASVAATS